MQNIQSQLGITRVLSDANKHLLVRNSHSLIKPIAVREPLIRPSRLFLSRKYKKSLNPVIGYENWNEAGLANESILTDYSEVNYSNDTSSNVTNTQNNYDISNLQEFDDSNPIITPINHDDRENIIKQKSQKQNTKKQNTKKKINKTKASTKIQKKSRSKVKVKKNNHNINHSELNSSQNINSQISNEELFTKNIQQQITDTNTNTNTNNKTKDSSSIINDDSDKKINPSFLQDENSQVVEYNDGNQNTQLLAEPNLSDSQNQESKLISDNHLNLFTSESSTVQKSQNPISSNQNKNLYINIDLDIDLNAKELDNNLTLTSKNFDKSSSQEKLSDITAENISKHENITSDITSDTLEPSTVVNDFSSHQDDNNQQSIIAHTKFPISNTIKQVEIPLEKIISTSNNQNFSVDSQSQPIITNPRETETTQLLSADNQEIQSKLYPDISNTDIHQKELLEDKNINESSNHPDLYHIKSEKINSENISDFSRYVEKSTKNLTPQPPSLPGNRENSKPLSLQERGLERGFPDAVKSQENISETITNELVENKSIISHLPSPISKEISTVINDNSNNQPNISKTDINQNFSVDSSSQPLVTTTRETQNNQIISNESTELEKLPITQDESTESQSTYVKNLEIKPISDDFHQLENITQDIFQSKEEENSKQLPIEPISDVADHNDELIKSNISDVNSQVSLPKQTDIELSEIEKTNHISTKEDTPTTPDILNNRNLSTLSPQLEDSIQTKPHVEYKKEDKNIVKSISKEQNNPDIQTTITTEQQPENISNRASEQNTDLNQQFNQKLNQKLNQKQKIQGYATGGEVIETKLENNQSIAPSDTVPAMLTPGEFVVNAKDTQQNIDVLQHINSGKKVEEIIQPSLEPSLEKSISPETSNTLLQKKESQVIPSPASNLLTSSPLGLEVGKDRLFHSPQLNQVDNTNHNITPSSTNNYLSSTLIFRKQSNHNNNHHNINKVPSQWSNVEELLNSQSDDFTTLFDFGTEETTSHNSESSPIAQTSSDSLKIAPKRIPEITSFNQNREAIPPDISREIEPISETIENPSFTDEADENKNQPQDTQDLENLANEIYLRLRQRLEIEKERQGISFGRLPW